MSIGKILKKLVKLPLLALIDAARREVEKWKQGPRPR